MIVPGTLGLLAASGRSIGDDTADRLPGVPVRVIRLEVPAAELRVHPMNCALIGSSGDGTVLSADATMVRRLIRASRADPVSIVRSDSGGPTREGSPTSINYVAWLDRVGDGPPGKTKGVAFRPSVESARVGTECSASVLPEKDGLLVRLAVRDSRLIGIETAHYDEKISFAPRPTFSSNPLDLISGLGGKRWPSAWDRADPCRSTVLGAGCLAGSQEPSHGRRPRAVPLGPERGRDGRRWPNGWSSSPRKSSFRFRRNRG